MKIGRLADRSGVLVLAACVLLLASSAVDGRLRNHTTAMSSAAAPPQRKPSPQESALVKAVRDATERFRNVSKAMQDGLRPPVRLRQRRRLRRDGTALRERGRSCSTAESWTRRRPRSCCTNRCRNGRVRITGADFWCSRPTGMRSTRGRRSSWVSSSTCSRARIASGFRRSTRCTCGRGRTTRTARSRTGTPTCAATHSTRDSRSRTDALLTGDQEVSPDLLFCSGYDVSLATGANRSFIQACQRGSSRAATAATRSP